MGSHTHENALSRCQQKKPHCFPSLLAKRLQQSSTGVKTIGILLDTLSRRRISLPSAWPKQNSPLPSPHSSFPQVQTYHTTTGGGGMSGRHRCQQQRLPYLFHVMAQQLKVKKEFKHLLIRRVGYQMRIWELWVLRQIRPFNPDIAPLPTWEAEIKPLLQRAWGLWKVHLVVLSQEYQT